MLYSMSLRPWCWERLRAGGEGDDRGGDGWMASLTQWTWVWVDFGSWWWTGRPGVLWFMGSQRVGHDWATELNCKIINKRVNRKNRRESSSSSALYLTHGCLTPFPLYAKLTTSTCHFHILMMEVPHMWVTSVWPFEGCLASPCLSCSSVTPWTAAHQASMSFTISWSLVNLMSIESMMLSKHLILCCPNSSKILLHQDMEAT